MGDLWFPDAVPDKAPTALWGTFADTGEPKFLLHTTEGGLGAYTPDPRTGDARRYFGHTNWPNYTLALRSGRWRVFWHIPSTRPGRALANRVSGVETNRDNVTQVEIAWKAAEIASLPGEALDELARLLAWEHEVRGVPLVSTVPWVSYPASYGLHAGQRLDPGEWDGYSGVLGHQHAPENDHGDPGKFPIEALLSRARELTGEEAVDMAAMDEIAERTVSLLQAQAWAQLPDGRGGLTPVPRQPNVGAMLRRDYEMTGETLGHVVVIRRLVEGIATGNAEVLLRNLSSADELDRLSVLAATLRDERRRAAG